jgi:hypothetical protein
VVPALDDETAVSVAVMLVHALVTHRGWFTATTLLPVLGRRRLPWDRDDVALLFRLAAQAKYRHVDALNAAANAAQVLEPADRATLAYEIQQALARIEAEDFSASERARLRVKLRALVPPVNDRTTMSRVDTRVIHRGDGWSAFALDRLKSVAEDTYQVTELLNHAAAAMSGPRPTKAWEKQAADLISGLPMASTLVRELLEGVLSCRPAPTRAYGIDLHLRVGPGNADLVRGLLWAAAILDEDWLVPVVTAIATDRMPRDPKLANASFAVLGRSGRADAIAALTQLKRATRDRGSLKQIARSLDEAAAAAGMSRSALLERAVPEGDLGPDGVRRTVIGEATAILTLDPAGRIQLEWERGGHRTSRVPADIAAEHGSQVSALKRDAAGVTSIAADPSWADRGEDHYFAYGERTAFGELTATGQTGRDVLERLLPRLKIRDRCRIAGNYLIVEGRKHLYKIHLGSANILMSPNDQYLCIVPARAATPRGVRFVPFDGDDILSVILAKALMLADDHRITDPSIRRQIG